MAAFCRRALPHARGLVCLWATLSLSQPLTISLVRQVQAGPESQTKKTKKKDSDGGPFLFAGAVR